MCSFVHSIDYLCLVIFMKLTYIHSIYYKPILHWALRNNETKRNWNNDRWSIIQFTSILSYKAIESISGFYFQFEFRINPMKSFYSNLIHSLLIILLCYYISSISKGKKTNFYSLSSRIIEIHWTITNRNWNRIFIHIQYFSCRWFFFTLRSRLRLMLCFDEAMLHRTHKNKK